MRPLVTDVPWSLSASRALQKRMNRLTGQRTIKMRLHGSDSAPEDFAFFA